MSDDIRVGDRFSVTVEVTDTQIESSGTAVDCMVKPVDNPAAYKVWMSGQSLLSGKRLPRPLKETDLVTLRDSVLITSGWRVKAVRGDMAWISSDMRQMELLRPLSDLTLDTET